MTRRQRVHIANGLEFRAVNIMRRTYRAQCHILRDSPRLYRTYSLNDSDLICVYLHPLPAAVSAGFLHTFLFLLVTRYSLLTSVFLHALIKPKVTL